jgi:glycosyltransferase involved in cell wall biosynthesis
MANNIKINFIGTVVDSVDLPKFESASVAGNKMQLGIIKGLYSMNKEIEVTSSYPHKMFKVKGKIFIPGKKSFIGRSINIRYVPYINVVFLKQITIFIGYLITLLIWCSKNRGDKALVVYNTLSYVALPVIIAGKIFKCKTFCVVADLPIKGIKKSIVQRIEDRMEIGLINKFNGLIPVTKHIQADFAPNTPFIVVEAGFEDVEEEVAMQQSTNQLRRNKNVVYTGTLNSLSGIELLLEAFSKIRVENAQLHIYGSGDKEEIVNSYVANDERIFFHGKISNEKIVEIQKNADLLVSPRLIDDFTTKYTFPSKVLEYITSGKPVLSNKLPGIPNEYDNLINFARTSDTDEWAKMIENIICDETDFYILKARKARMSVKKYKTWEFQSERIYGFISSFYSNNEGKE